MASDTPQTCMSRFTAALLRRDMPAALELLADDAVLFYGNGTALWGAKQFEANMKAAWKIIEQYKYETLDSVWLAQSDTAATVVYTFALYAVANVN